MTCEMARCGPCGEGLRRGRRDVDFAAATRWRASQGGREPALEAGAAVFLLDARHLSVRFRVSARVYRINMGDMMSSCVSSGGAGDGRVGAWQAGAGPDRESLD